MSLQPAPSSPQAAAKRNLFKLQNAGQHAQWKSNLQDYMFDKFHDVNMDKITSVFTLDIDFFAKHSDFKDDYKIHSKNGDNIKVDPFVHCPAYGVMCFDHAIKTGDGFKPWLYTTFSYVRAALSDTIQRQTGQVRRGDLKALLSAIRLAVHLNEQYDPDALDIAYLKCTMEGEGDNDIMTFIAALSSYILRLEAVDMSPSEARKTRVLLTGLNQDVYENFVSAAERTPYATYAELQHAVEGYSTKPRVLAALRALKPGRSESFHPTLPGVSSPKRLSYAQAVKSPHTQRLDRMEHMLATTLAAHQAPGRHPAAKGMDKPKAPCFNMRDSGKCAHGDGCRFSHDGLGQPQPKLHCLIHGKGKHSSENCSILIKNPGLKVALQAGAASHNGRPGAQQFHSSTTSDDAEMGCSFIYSMGAEDIAAVAAKMPESDTAKMPEFVFATRASPAKIDQWCVDGAATSMATWDRARCFNIRSCSVQIYGSNSAVEEGKMVCSEVGDTYVTTYNQRNGRYSTTLLTNVLISELFPFHIFSEIVAFDRANTCVKAKDDWTFFSDGDFVLHASQRLLHDPSLRGRSDSKLYWIDQEPPAFVGGVVQLPAARLSAQFSCRTCTFEQARTPQGIDEYFGDMDHTPGEFVQHTADELVGRAATISATRHVRIFDPEQEQPMVGLQAASPQIEQEQPMASLQAASPQISFGGVSASSKPISAKKNLQLLLELHCAHDHWNFEDVASQYGLSLPSPRPVCWACLMAKPRRIAHDKVSTRQTERPLQGIAADAKGPFKPTPEGFKYFFLLVCLYSSFYWVRLAKSQDEWKKIWPDFVKEAEAHTGKQQTISLIITDGHKVHSAGAVKAFNADRGIKTVSSAPHSQWQDPAERGIQTIMNGARASLIHGGGSEWMWGWAVQHSADSANRMKPPHSLPGREGESRLQVMDASMTVLKSMRTHRPFLSLCFKTKPANERGTNFNPRSDPCLVLGYVKSRKSFALLTIPNLYLTFSVEVRFVSQVFPLRVTNVLSSQISAFLRPAPDSKSYSAVHGPGGLLNRTAVGAGDIDYGLVEPTPVLTRPQVDQSALPGPAWSSTRGYKPSLAGLLSAASGKPTPPDVADVSSATMVAATEGGDFADGVQLFTKDQLAARTPRNGPHALNGPDRAYWLPGIKKDFAVIRDNMCIINVTSVRPHGPPPPPVEQRFKIKHFSEKPIALADIDPANWKARTVARGDRFKYGVHFDATAAPVVHTPALKMLVAWAVAKGLLLFQWDVGAAFYGNKMDRTGVIVQLPPGYDPYSTAIRPLHLPPLYGELAGALPGIPQGSLLHYQAIGPELNALGFKALPADNCLFLHDTIEMATTLHVDDGILACPSLEHAELVLGPAGLGSKRKITWGPLAHTLGVDFKVLYTPQKRVVFMSQRPYAVTILERAGKMGCKPARTPAAAGRVYTKADCPQNDDEKADMQRRGFDKHHYHTVQASINFYVSITRDDMRFINGKLAKFVGNPGEEHFKAQDHQLAFIEATKDYGIEFSWRSTDPAPVDGPLVLEAWSDSSFGDDKDTGRTTLAWLAKVNDATVLSASKLSARVDSCVNHSELHAFGAAIGSYVKPAGLTDGASTSFARAGRDVTWLRGVKAGLERRDVATMPPTPVYVDNAGVISMLKDTTLKTANKHIFRALQENRERVNIDKIVMAVKVDTKLNLANALTKQEPSIHASAAQLRLITGPCSIQFDK